MDYTGIFDSIINDPGETQAVSKAYVDLTGDETEALSSLADVDDALMKYWLGEGGDAFEILASEIEKRLDDMTKFTENSSFALDETILNFFGTDTDRQGSIDVSVTAPTGQEG